MFGTDDLKRRLLLASGVMVAVRPSDARGLTPAYSSVRPVSPSAACAAASFATGTRGGEQLT